MQARWLYISFFYVVILSIIGCSQQTEGADYLKKAIFLADSDPIAALRLIDSINDPKNSLTKKQYMQYLVAHTQIYYKNYLPIEDDSLIFTAVHYYQKNHNDSKQTALAYFYAGTVLKSKEKYDLTMEYYKNAEKYAKKLPDPSILGLINFNMADLLAEQGRYRKALIKYELSAKNYSHYPAKQAYAFSSMGRMLLFNHNADSAFFFFHKSLKIAENLADLNLQRQLAESLSVAYEQVKKYTESQRYLWYSLSLNTDSTRLPRYYLNFALLYDKSTLTDSVTYYAEKLKNVQPRIKDYYLRASVLSFLIEYEKKEKHISTALDYQSDRMNILIQIMKEREKQSIYKIEKRYNYEQIEKQYYESLTIKQRWIIVFMGTVILGGILFLFYRTKQKNRQKAIQNKVNTLTEMNDDLESKVHRKQVDLRRQLLWRFEITKKILKINNEINKRGRSSTESGLVLKQFNTIVYGQSSLEEQWETLHQAFIQGRPGYAEKIKTHFPELTETEYRICVLTNADFSVKEIALILQHSSNTIQTRRTSLRKKLGVPNGGDIADSIDRLFD